MADESTFKKRLIQKIEREYPGAIILKNNANQIQGIPDHIILFGPRWAMFEAKAYKTASHRINQDYYINLLNDMSLARFVFPENEEEFLNELQQALRSGRRARFSIGV